MGLFNNLFSGAEEKIKWNHIKSMDDLDAIHEKSKETTQVIFKHSTRCSISSMALNRVEREFDLDESHVDMNFLDLIQFRSISNEIADKYNVFHESPQMIVIKNGEVCHHASHNGIDIKLVRNWINE